MIETIQRRTKAATALVIGILFLSSCLFLAKEEKKVISVNYYEFEPKSILEDLHEQGQDVDRFFSLTSEPVYESSPPSLQSFNWREKDYAEILTAFFRLELKDNIIDWYYTYRGFSLSCAEVNQGFYNGQFELFVEATDTKGQRKRLVRFVEIDLRRKIITFTEVEYAPALFNWRSIDTEKFKVANADEALVIAEANGGKEKRMQSSSPCYISVAITASARQNTYWYVNYGHSETPTPFFEVDIDPTAGEIR